MNDDIDIESYQVEVLKLGGSEVVELLVSTVRGARGRRKLLGEATLRDWRTPVIQFRVLHAKDLDDLRDRFIRQLIWRGYEPKRWRSRIGGKLLDWSEVDPGAYDVSEMKKVSESPVEFTE